MAFHDEIATLMKSMDLRFAIPSDLNAIETITRAAYSHYIAAMRRAPAPMGADFRSQIEAGIVVVSLRGSDVVGYVVRYPTKDAMHIENVAVEPEVKGRGYGGALITSCEDAARAMGLGAVELYTNEKMHANLTLYPRLGYVERDRCVEDGFTRVYFRKDL